MCSRDLNSSSQRKSNLKSLLRVFLTIYSLCDKSSGCSSSSSKVINYYYYYINTTGTCPFQISLLSCLQSYHFSSFAIDSLCDKSIECRSRSSEEINYFCYYNSTTGTCIFQISLTFSSSIS